MEKKKSANEIINKLPFDSMPLKMVPDMTVMQEMEVPLTQVDKNLNLAFNLTQNVQRKGTQIETLLNDDCMIMISYVLMMLWLKN